MRTHLKDRELNDVMEFDHVIRVHEDGTITDVDGVWAPEVYHEDVHPSPEQRERHSSGATVAPAGWEFLNGYSGQDGYPGPIMHPSEYIGGGMETEIRETPGVYVAVVVECLTDPDAPAEAVACEETGRHLTSCDLDGYCNFCGDQWSAETAEIEPAGWAVLRQVEA